MRDPFLCDGPTIINVSGGRTSSLMLRRTLDAHGGTLPADAHVTVVEMNPVVERWCRGPLAVLTDNERISPLSSAVDWEEVPLLASPSNQLPIRFLVGYDGLTSLDCGAAFFF
jgi:hypothetical protein